MRKNKTKILALGLACALTFGAAGCGNGNIGKDSGTSGGGTASQVTQISIREWGGTSSSTSWLQDSINRFTKLKENESYEEGKKGVKITRSSNKDNDYTSSIPDYDIIMDENKANMYDMQTRGYLADINDLVKGMESKIEPQLLAKLKGADGKYYALPHYSYDVGISYNVDLFESLKLYIAAPEETDVVNYKGDLLSADSAGVNFIGSDAAKKSCGPDGKYGTYDDGLPSSLEEFIVLCSYIKNKGVNPFALSAVGEGGNYAFMLIEALWSGLVGTDAMKATTCNFTDAEVEVVKDGALAYTGETFLNTGIKVPQTETVVLSDENGYKMYDMSARYFALSFLELARSKGWFHSSTNLTNLKAQEYFVLGDSNIDEKDRCAMLIDSTYWYGEATASGALSTYKNYNSGEEANVSLMPMPVQLTGQVTEGNGKAPTVIDTSSLLFVNKRVEKNEGVYRAVKEFIEFLYSDAELKAFTETSKLTVNMTYDYDESQLGKFYQGVHAIEKAAGTKVYTSSTNDKFVKNRDSFSLIWGGKLNYFGNYHNGAFSALQDGKSASEIFEMTRRAKVADWENLG